MRTHAERMYSAAIMPQADGARVLLRKIKAGALGESFTVRDVDRKKWSGLTAPDDVRKACDVLSEYNWIRPMPTEVGPGGGRPSERYTVNPAAIGETDCDPKKTPTPPSDELTKLPKPPFVSFVSAMNREEGNFQGGQAERPELAGEPAGGAGGGKPGAPIDADAVEF